VEIAASEWLGMRHPDLDIDGIFKIVPRWDKHISVLGDYVEKIMTLQSDK
jgi:hypothetical protein